MLIKELAITIKDLIAKIKSEKEEIRFDENHHISQESQITLSELNEFLKNHADSTLEANAENLKPFIDLLAARYFNRIKSSDEIYYANMGTHANRIYYAIAQELEKIVGISIHHLLLPELNKNLKFEKPLRYYIVSDDSQTLVDVLKCFEDSSSRADGKFMHTHSVDGQSKELSETEKDRLRGFSCYALDPFKSIVDSKKATNTIRPLRSEIKAGKPFITVKAYEFTYVQKKEITLISSLADILVVLAKHGSNKWHSILNNLPKDQLEKCIFPDMVISYKSFIESVPSRVKNDVEYRILQMCINVLYARNRCEQLDYVASKPSATLFGQAYDFVANNVAYYRGADSKTIKERVINILIDYWSQTKQGDVDEFFATEFNKLYRDEFKDNYQAQFQTHKHAFENGDVGSMRQAAISGFASHDVRQAKVVGQ